MLPSPVKRSLARPGLQRAACRQVSRAQAHCRQDRRRPANDGVEHHDLITATPKLRRIFASNLTMTQGAGQALAENKLGDEIMLIGFDSDDKTVKLLADGNLQALVVQDAFWMGYEGVKTALAASKDEKVPENVDTRANVITKENMNTER